MTRGSILLLVAGIWAIVLVGMYLLVRRAARLIREERAHSRQLQRCIRGDHLDTLDTRIDGLPQLGWRCVACGERVVLGVAYATGTNRRRRRTKHG